MDKPSVLRAACQVEVEYSSFLNELQKLEVLEYPTIACRELIGKLTTQAQKNSQNVKQMSVALAASGPSIDVKLYRDRILFERRKLIEVLTKFLDWIIGAQTQKVPWSFIPSIERMAQQIIPNYQPILYCRNLYNYEIQWYQQLFGKLDEYSFISLPRLHRTNILMHTLLGHELFHPYCDLFTSKFISQVAENVTKAVKKTFPTLDPTNLFDKRTLGEKNTLVLTSWKRAIHELLCDMFCAEIFGPASLLASRALASFSDWKTMPDEPNFYPPFQYRLEVVWQNAIDKNALRRLFDKHAEAHEIIISFESWIKQFGGTLEGNEGLTFVCEHELNKIAYLEVEKLVSQARDYAISKVPASMSKWSDEKVLDQIPILVDRLKSGIPPNEIINIGLEPGAKNKWNFRTEHAELPAILMAGWIYQVYRETNMGKQDLLSYDTLSRLLLKACEDSEMLRSG